MKTKERNEEKEKKRKGKFWIWMILSVIFRLILIYFPNLNLFSRPEVSTPLTSIRRLAEGYWLKQSSMSPYAGSMYHGSPMLLSLLGPLTVKRIEGQPDHLLCSFAFVVADVLSALLIRAIGQNLQRAYYQSLRLLKINLSKNSEIFPAGDIASLVYLWNPFTIVACVGLSTSPIENLAVVLTLFGASKGQVSLAAFGFVMATHLSLYPIILIIPVVLLLGNGLDAPPRKLFSQKSCSRGVDGPSSDSCSRQEEMINQPEPNIFSLRPVIYFLLWVSLFSTYLLLLCGVSLKQFGGLWEMFRSTYGFILTVQDLSPNIGVLWYLFAEVFEFFRDFYLIVFHINILFMIMPLSIRLHHRPLFLAFVLLSVSAMLKSYPSVGDSALYLSFMGLFVDELVDLEFSFFLFCGYIGISLLSPVMHNLWIWRGTGNANFYFANAMAYACFQIVLVVESVSTMLNHDRKLRKLSAVKLS
ncbi:phosphatidylinositol glycan anchor biosynthesis class U protein-like isoform X2 [Momordica charantia]|uniref:Phosphatidylinositol glycan anchor biosynthesis class U protein-like isoform X2 n=1 Tax=Momordica charantia TaxID=3673 RepID=A0A6J1E014_MOMCH|nr:phosphatidylinositol glycan anchor biosynthesis class U protein-like isoform X2 [Momordica charantia]